MLGMVLGGIGLFLLGMALLTDGLVVAAGDGLRRALERAAASTLSSVATGAVSTAIVQSSSATTLLTIGFVGAGMLSLPSALGVVFGANVGTTVTSWIVATIGLKVKMNTFALPLVGVGALVRLFAKGRRSAMGTALAGFGLVFVGIDVLQSGMSSAAASVDLAAYAGRGPLALGTMVLAGMFMTVVMQSSSAAVTTTLAAVDGGTIGLVQAAALVIGQNVGTTITAGIGAIGGSAAVRRTALAHLLFNVATGAVALALLPVLWPIAGARLATRDPAIVISAFHTAFNLLGVVMFAPFVHRLAGWLERRIPDVGAELTRRLATGRGASRGAIVDACRTTARDIARETLRIATATLREPENERELVARRDAVARAIEATRSKLHAIRTDPNTPHDYGRHVATLHALDHLHRLVEALGEEEHIHDYGTYGEMQRDGARLAEHFEALSGWWTARSDPKATAAPMPDVEGVSRSVAEGRRAERPRVLERTARGELAPRDGEKLLEAMRWVDRLGYHAWRAHHHLEPSHAAPPASAAP